MTIRAKQIYLNLILFFIVILCLVVFAYYGLYKQQEYLLAPLSFRIFLYGCIPSFALVLLLVIWKAPSSFKINLILLSCSCLVAFYMIDLSLLILSSKPECAEAKKSGIDCDRRSKWQVVLDLRKKDTDAYPQVSPIDLLVQQADGTYRSKLVSKEKELLPVSSISNKSTVLCNENGKYLIYESDQFGFNNSNDIWDVKNIDIAILGDSFLHGFCVDSERSVAGLIKKLYPSTLNLAFSGNGPLLEFAALHEYLRFLKPKKVLWFFLWRK